MPPRQGESLGCPAAERKEDFQSFWYGERLSPVANACINSFRAHDFGFVLYTYDRMRNVPPSVTIKNAADIAAFRAIYGESVCAAPRTSWAWLAPRLAGDK